MVLQLEHRPKQPPLTLNVERALWAILTVPRAKRERQHLDGRPRQLSWALDLGHLCGIDNCEAGARRCTQQAGRFPFIYNQPLA